jgi:glycosyltransferase involved in cell wall biosynthesis
MKVVFFSFKSLLDNNSGAALEIKAIFEKLATQGVSCFSCCMNCYDTGDDYTDDERISKSLNPRKSAGKAFKHEVNGVLHYLYVAQSKNTMKASSVDLKNYIQLAHSFLNQEAPDIVVFFGSKEMMPLLTSAKALGSKIVYYVGNASISTDHQPLFLFSDAIVVPSDFVGHVFQEKFKIEFRKIPTTLPFAMPEVTHNQIELRRQTGFVTLVNPTPDKGGHVFFEIAERFKHESRQFLCIESRGKRNFWKQNGVNVDRYENVLWAPWQSDIRKLLESTAILLMPSLVKEAAGKVIAEAMSLGIPCIGYDIGGIAEQIGKGGVTIPFTSTLASDPETRKYRAVSDTLAIEAWETAIRRLLEDPSVYQETSQHSMIEAERFTSDRTSASWLSLFSELSEATSR